MFIIAYLHMIALNLTFLISCFDSYILTPLLLFILRNLSFCFPISHAVPIYILCIFCVFLVYRFFVLNFNFSFFFNLTFLYLYLYVLILTLKEPMAVSLDSLRPLVALYTCPIEILTVQKH